MISTLRGMRDIYGEDSVLFRRIEDAARKVFSKYGFDEIKIPVMERTELFSRGIGGDTDIVSKEMYTFLDRKNRSVTLRPEGTAGVVRHYIEKGMDKNDAVKRYFYSGPMFRYERPQKGRFRQFYQIGVEAFGESSFLLDAEVIIMLTEFFAGLGMDDVSVSLNNIGCPACRPAYDRLLKDYFMSRRDELCPDCAGRIEKNPLRILDCKKDSCAPVIAGAPLISDHLCGECRDFSAGLLSLLKGAGVNHSLDTRLVRGLDYYTRTVFEIYSRELGAQNAIMGGGRYDGLVGELGGRDVPGFGFALGVDRIVDMLKEREGGQQSPPDGVFLVWNTDAPEELLAAAAMIRRCGIRAEMFADRRSVKSQMRYADKKGYRYVVFLGDEEIGSEELHIKDLRNGAEFYSRPENLTDIIN